MLANGTHSALNTPRRIQSGRHAKGGNAMEIKVLLCNCKGLCDSFKEADMNTLPFAVESDLT
jgi:hypothetical protein